MGYPGSDRKQLFYRWDRRTNSFVYDLVVYTNGWWRTYVTALAPRKLGVNDQDIIYNMLSEQTGLDWKEYELVQA